MEEEQFDRRAERHSTTAAEAADALARANSPAVVFGEMAIFLGIILGLALAVNLVV
jgi:hypothetical protein